MTKESSTADREIVIERVFNAPRDLVFTAWGDPKHVDNWMGPRGFTTTTKSMDFKVGGRWVYMMKHAEYGEFPNRVVYREIVKNERLAYTHSRDIDNDPEAFETVVTFEAQGDKTKLTMRTIFPTAELLKEKLQKVRAVEGGNQTLDKLGEWLAKQ